MATVRTVARGSRRYRYLVQSYRWEGRVRKKQKYLGTSIPANLDCTKELLERSIWDETWFPLFDGIKAAYQRYRRQLPDSVRREEARDFVLAFTYDSNRIEGTTLSLADTRRLLERGLTPPGKPLADVQEAASHAKLVHLLLERPEPLDLGHLLRWHRELFGATKSDIAGRLRDHEVRIQGSRHAPPISVEVRPMLLELLRWASRSVGRAHPVEIAAAFHWRFEHIHPFGDGNGRIGRLAMNVLLEKHGYPLFNIRYTRRRGYFDALESASLKDDPKPFLGWFYLRYARAYRGLGMPPFGSKRPNRERSSRAGRYGG